MDVRHRARLSIPPRTWAAARRLATSVGRWALSFSVRRSVAASLAVAVALAGLQLAIGWGAISSAAFILKRAEISHRELTDYQQLSIDTLEYLVAAHTPGDLRDEAAHQRFVVEARLAGLEKLTAAEAALTTEIGTFEGDLGERERLLEIRSTIERIFAADQAQSEIRSESVSTYHKDLQPIIAAAIAKETSEIAALEQSMRDLQERVGWLGRLWICAQVAIGLLVLLIINKFVLDPLSRLVADIREFGRDHLGHRVQVRRHDEFGLLAQHVNRMARHLERSRLGMLALNRDLEATVCERTSALQARNDELHEIDASRRRFFADVSHELRTPLTAIVGEADLILRAPDLDPGANLEAVSSILANAKFLNRRIDDLLALARSMNGQLELYPELVDLNSIAGEAMIEIKSLAKVNKVMTRLEALADPALIQGDRRQLRQCLMILLDNAVKFSRAYQPVDMVVRRVATHAEVTVLDLGKGIPAEDLPRVFEPFYQSEVGRQKGGTGLGLSIARRIVEAHRGAIAATGTASGGTAITITIPLAQGPRA